LNRIKEKGEDPGEGPAGDYYMIGTPCSFFWVDAETAARVGRALSRVWPRRWLRIVDRNGSRAWVRTELVEYIQESTAVQRERGRAFHRARRNEAKADRRWDEDD
jgi:hypothetical protein